MSEVDGMEEQILVRYKFSIPEQPYHLGWTDGHATGAAGAYSSCCSERRSETLRIPTVWLPAALWMPGTQPLLTEVVHMQPEE